MDQVNKRRYGSLAVEEENSHRMTIWWH